MIIERKSTASNKLHTREIAITEEELSRWELGEHIHIVCPNLSADDREFIISGVTPEEWSALFGDDE